MKSYFLSFYILLNFAHMSCVTFNLNLNDFNEIPSSGNWVVATNGNWNNWGSGITLYVMTMMEFILRLYVLLKKVNTSSFMQLLVILTVGQIGE